MRKQKDKDEVEEQENLEIPHDCVEHGYDVTYCVKDSQEEESLVDHHQVDDSHGHLALEIL